MAMLTADEKVLARRYSLQDFFQRNGNYGTWAMDTVQILEKQLGVGQYAWSMNGFVQFARELLERSEAFFSHVNELHAKIYRGPELPSSEFKRVCEVAAKILVYVGCDNVSKRA